MKMYYDLDNGTYYTEDELRNVFELRKEELKEDGYNYESFEDCLNKMLALGHQKKGGWVEMEAKKFVVNLYDPSTGATSDIDVITAPEGYTAENYVADCERNADDDWNAMLSSGEVILMEVE